MTRIFEADGGEGRAYCFGEASGNGVGRLLLEIDGVLWIGVRGDGL